MTSEIKCINNITHVNMPNNDPADYYLEINAPQSINGLEEMIAKEMKSTEILSDWKCDICQLYGGIKSKSVSSSNLSKFLLVKLRRGIRDQYANSLSINTSKVKPPQKITITSTENIQHEFSLCGIIRHHGDGKNLDDGHYTAEVKYGQTWYNCDDAHISETTFENLSMQGYGYLFVQSLQHHER